MKKILLFIGVSNLSVVPVVSTISCSTLSENNNGKTKNTKGLEISKEDEKKLENVVKSVDDILILTKLKGGIDATGILTSNSTFNDAIKFLQTKVQEIDSNASVISNENDKLNNNLTINNNTISVKFKKDKGQIVNALITNVHDHELRSSSNFVTLMKSIFEESINGAHLSVVNDYGDILPVINEKLDDVDEEIKVTLAEKQEKQKLNSGNNTIKIKFVDKDANECILPINIKDVQNKGFAGKLKDEYPNNVVFQIADHDANDFGIQKLEKINNLSALDLLKKINTIIKSTGHHKIDETKYKQEYGNSSEEDLNESREVAKTSTRKTGFLTKIKDKLKFKKSRSSFKSSELYATTNYKNFNTFEFPAWDTDDDKPEMLKINLLMKENNEDNWEANYLIKPLLSEPINGKTLNMREKYRAIIPLVRAKLNTISGLHQWIFKFKYKKEEQSFLSEQTTVELLFAKTRPLSTVQFTVSVTVNKITKIKKDSVDLSILPKRIDATLWGLTTSSTLDHLLKNIILILKINTAKFIIEPAYATSKSFIKSYWNSKLTEKNNEKPLDWHIIPKIGGRADIIKIKITLFNIKPGKEKTSVFDKLYNKTQQIDKKIGQNFESVKNKLFNKSSNSKNKTSRK